MRNLIAPIVLAGILGLWSPAFANEVSLHKHSLEELKSVCDKVGGSFSQGADVYACGTDCHGKPGTACVVDCKADQTCFAQVIGGRRPTDLTNALQAPPQRSKR